MSARRSDATACLPAKLRQLLIVVSAAGLTACSTAEIDRIPTSLGGLPEGAPVRPAETREFPAVHDMPPARPTTPLDAEQQKRLEADLIAARNRQARSSDAKGQKGGRGKEKTAAKGEAATKKPAKKPPTLSETGLDQTRDTGRSRSP